MNMGKRFATGLAVFLSCLCFVGGRAAAAAADSAPQVTEIRVRNDGPGRVDPGFVLAHVSSRSGGPLDRGAIARDVRDVLGTGRFADVKVEVEPDADGVRVIFAVCNKLRLADGVEVVGGRHLSVRRVRDLLGLEKGDLIDDQVLGVRARKVTARYREDLYHDATVSWDIEELDRAAGLAHVRVSIDEGRKARVRRVEVSGNTAVSSRTLVKFFSQPARWNPLWFFRKKSFDDYELEAARTQILDVYLDRGYLDAVVEMPQRRKEMNGDVVITTTIREGEPYAYGQASIAGVALFPESELTPFLTMKPGARASMGEVSNTARNLRDFYGSRGYVDTRVRPVLDPDPDLNTVNVKFDVEEGRLVHIRNINIRGNTRTRDKVIRRELLVYPGEEFNEVRVRRSERRLSNLGFFDSVRSYPQSTSLPEERDLMIEVSEKRTGQFMLGAGFSSIDKLVGFVELTQGNFDIKGWPYFTGGGQKLKLRAQFGTTRNEYGISFVEPWFLDRKLSVGVDLYRNDYGYSDYDIERTGGALSVTRSLPYGLRGTFVYRLEESILSDIDDDQPYVDILSGEPVEFLPEDAIKSSLKVSVTRDTRNNPFMPTRGTRATVFGHFSGGPLGFDTDIYGFGLRVKHYVPLWYGHVLSMMGRAEVVDEYGDTAELPISDRLFIGGGRTLRGFDYRDVGPKARRADAPPGDTSYRPYGGRSLAMASAEYTVPVVSGVRLAGFYDVGNTWFDMYDFDFSTLASSTGVGIRLDMPGFPIRIDRAWVIEKDNDITDEDSWVIWIGYDY